MTSTTTQPQAASTGAQEAGQNGTGSQSQPQNNQAPLHGSPGDSQSQPAQAAPAQAGNAAAPTPGLAAGPILQTAATAPTAATAAATGPARYGVGLDEAVEAVKTTIELGARQGFSQAKIQLAPATLGQITIHLQKTSDGIVAKVVAEHSAAAQTMQQGGDDLRRSLQNSGLHLLRLDVETRGDQRGSANGGAPTSQSDRTAGPNDTAADDGASQPTTIVLPNGALVNVLA
jgi:flagellar hook-length control protein FliK